MKWTWALGGIIALGVFSRMAPLGFVLWDKYLGDALYAAMVYCIIRWIRVAPAYKTALASMAAMTAIEAFQLTGIARIWLGSSSAAVRIVARLMGTEFSWLDLLAYAIGIAVLAAIDHRARMTE